MFGFFNRQSTWRGITQGVNLAVAAIVTYDLISNPEAKASRLGVDIACHLFTAVALQEQSPILGEFSAAAFNVFRLGEIYSSITCRACTNIPLAAIAVDSLIHMINISTALFIGTDEAPKENGAKLQ